MFERTVNILTQISGLEGAVIVNFHTNELLAQTPQSVLPMASIVPICAQTVREQQLFMRDLDCCDVVEQMVTTTTQHHHIHYLPSQFDNVVIYAVVRRSGALPIIFRLLEEAGYSMS